jgi:hypothetical protein
MDVRNKAAQVGADASNVAGKSGSRRSCHGLLKVRIRHHQTQRGAAVFIVVLVIMMLTGLGLYAVRSASLTNRAAGYGRQMTQTHYVADYAVSLLVSSMDKEAENHANLMQGVMVANPDQGCLAYSKLLRPTCARYSYGWLQGRVAKHNSKQLLFQKTLGKQAGSFGPGELEADMKIELTDLHPAWPPMAGMQADCTGGGGVSKQHVMVTLSAEGQVRPQQVKPGQWDTTSATAAAIEQVRAHVIMGPVSYNCGG